MFTTYEIRWFFDRAERGEKAIEEWFGHITLTPKSGSEYKSAIAESEQRVDFYIAIPAINGLSIKLREGKIEIKQRLPDDLDKFDAPGKVERWQKWSINMKGDKDLAEKIVGDKKFDWITVPKERFGFKYRFDGNNEFKEVNINEHIPEGCQVEYTHFQVNDKKYYTFGFEAFSETNNEKQNFQKGLEYGLNHFGRWDMAQARILPPKPHLRLENSMGYPEFLEKVSTQSDG